MKSQSTAKGFAMLSMAGVATKILSLLYIPILVSIINTDGFGIYQKVYEVFTFIYAVTSMGLQVAVTKIISELSVTGNHIDSLRAFKLARNTMAAIGAMAAILIIIFANDIEAFTNNAGIAYGLILLAPSIMISTILVSYRGYFQAYNLMNKVAISQVFEEIANKIFSLACAFILINFSVELGAAGGTVGTSIGAIIACLYLFYLFKKNKYDNENIKVGGEQVQTWSDKKILKTIFLYSLPITLSAGMQNLGALVDTFNVNSRLLAIGYVKEQANTAYGILGEYKTIMYVPLIIITALSVAVLPTIVKAITLNNKEEVKSKVLYALKMTLIISIPSALGMMVLSEEIYMSLFGTTNGSELMKYGGLVVVFMALTQIQTTILQSANKFKFIIKTLFLGIVAKLICNYYLIGMPEINIMGAVIGGYSCFMIPSILNNKELKKALKIKFSLFEISKKPIIASFIMVGVIILFRILIGEFININGRVIAILLLSIFIIIGIVVYGIVIILIGGIVKTDIEGVSPRILNTLPMWLISLLK